MRRILAIFRKDIRHLWPQVALLLSLIALAAILDPTYSRAAAAYYEVLPLLLVPMACWLVIVSVIHEEKLPGDRQYWLTRPYGWKDLLAAKLMFVAAFVNLPLLVCHAAVFTAVGIPLPDQIAPLFWRQVFFTAFYILPAAALASITRNIGRMLAAAILAGAGVWLFGSALMLLTRRPAPFYQSTHEMTVFRAALLSAGVSAILVLQYARRRTALAGGIAAALASALLLPSLFGPAPANRSSAACSQAAQLSLTLDPERRIELVPEVDPNLVTLEFPVRLNRVPAGLQLDSPRIPTVQIGSPGRQALTGWGGQLHDLDAGRAWLSVLTFRGLLRYVHEQGHPVDVSGSFELRLFSAMRVLPLPKGNAVTVPEVGVCRDLIEPKGAIAFSCDSTSPSPHAALLVRTPGQRATWIANWIVPPGFVSRSIPTAAGFQPLTRFVSLLSYRDWGQVGPARLIAADPLPPLRVDFRLTGVRLPP